MKILYKGKNFRFCAQRMDMNQRNINGKHGKQHIDVSEGFHFLASPFATDSLLRCLKHVLVDSETRSVVVTCNSAQTVHVIATMVKASCMAISMGSVGFHLRGVHEWDHSEVFPRLLLCSHAALLDPHVNTKSSELLTKLRMYTARSTLVIADVTDISLQLRAFASLEVNVIAFDESIEFLERMVECRKADPNMSEIDNIHIPKLRCLSKLLRETSSTFSPKTIFTLCSLPEPTTAIWKSLKLDHKAKSHLKPITAILAIAPFITLSSQYAYSIERNGEVLKLLCHAIQVPLVQLLSNTPNIVVISSQPPSIDIPAQFQFTDCGFGPIIRSALGNNCIDVNFLDEPCFTKPTLLVSVLVQTIIL